jgi:hypothetical protein
VLAAGMRCVGYALPERIFSLREAGAHDIICEFPLDAARYFQRIIEMDLRGHAVRGIGATARRGE